MVSSLSRNTNHDMMKPFIDDGYLAERLLLTHIRLVNWQELLDGAVGQSHAIMGLLLAHSTVVILET